jgi:hypothetical protein
VELRDLYSSPSIIRVIKSRRTRWAGHVKKWGRRGMHIGCCWESRRKKRPLGRPRHRWVNNIKMDLVEMGWCDVDWIDLAQDRDRWRALVNSVLNLQVP